MKVNPSNKTTFNAGILIFHNLRIVKDPLKAEEFSLIKVKPFNIDDIALCFKNMCGSGTVIVNKNNEMFHAVNCDFKEVTRSCILAKDANITIEFMV